MARFNGATPRSAWRVLRSTGIGPSGWLLQWSHAAFGVERRTLSPKLTGLTWTLQWIHAMFSVDSDEPELPDVGARVALMELRRVRHG